MLALHLTPVPTAKTPTPAQVPGGGTGTFSAQLAAFTTPAFNAPDDLANSTALGGSMAGHKQLTKANDGAAGSLAGAMAAAGQQPIPLAANSNASTNGASAGPSVDFTNGKVPLFTGTPTAATSQLAAPLGTGATIALTAPTAASQTKAGATSSLPATAQVAAANSAKAFALPPTLAAQAQANAQTKAAPPPTVTTSQLGAAVATSAGAPQVSSATAALTHGTSTTTPGNATTTQTATANTTATTGNNSSAPAAPTPANGAVASAQTPPGAADLNARVVAGAASLTAQPNQAVNASNALMQPHDPNAGAIPPAVASSVGPTGKTQPLSGIAPGKSDSSALGNISASPDQTAQFHNAVAATDRSNTPNNDTSSNPQGNGPNQQPANVVDPSTLAAPAGATLATQQSSAPASPTTSAPATALPAAYIAVPASDQVAAQLKQAVKIGANEIQIQLKPATLGSIDVKLNVTHDGRLTAVISADRSDTLNLLKQDSGNLQQALRNAGFNADSSSLSFNLSGGNAQTSQQNTPHQNTASGSTVLGTVGDNGSTPVAAYASRQHNGSVDIQV
jgi:flagellar hook-length control protein FliK